MRRRVAFRNLPSAFDGFRLLILGDLHIDDEQGQADRLSALLAEVEADAMLLLGDYRRRISGPHREAVERTRRIVAAARVSCGCYAVRGNHDSPELMDELASDVVVLRNSVAVLQRDDQRLCLLGVDDAHYDGAADLQAAVAAAPPQAFKVLLAHTAELYREAAAAGIDLYCCGHTHGGQIRIAGRPVITNTRAPRQWAYGFWNCNGMVGYTTSGVGTSAVSVRFNCPPEVVLLTLEKEIEAE